MNPDKFIFCLEAVLDAENPTTTEAVKNLEQLALEQGITSIHKTCDTIEGLEESLNALRYEDHNFSNYEIIYLLMQGEANTICLNEYHYSLEEIAELFEGKMTGKILHFANTKVLDLNEEEAQYFLDITGARAISGYGIASHKGSSSPLDNAFFSLCNKEEDVVEIVEELHEKYYTICQQLDFRLYY
jgi:hypothetical protein